MRRLADYGRLITKRVYRPIKPVVNPLLRKVKLVYVLAGLVILGIGGSLWDGWRPAGNEQLGWWPWSAKSHSEMALAWFEDGNEEEALKELKRANELVWWETEEIKKGLKRAEEKVMEPERIRREIESWEKVLEEKPYYRDVLLRLALLNYQIYEDEKAETYWQQANYLDPNNEEGQEVGEIIFSSP